MKVLELIKILKKMNQESNVVVDSNGRSFEITDISSMAYTVFIIANKTPHETSIHSIKSFEDGMPCSHPGCMHHVTHPCEGCGRTWGSVH